MRVTPRRRAREFVLQGLYQRQLSGNAPDAIREHLVEASGFRNCDAAYFEAMWSGVVADFEYVKALPTKGEVVETVTFQPVVRKR